MYAAAAVAAAVDARNVAMVMALARS